MAKMSNGKEDQRHNTGMDEFKHSDVDLTNIERKFLMSVERGDAPSTKVMLNNQVQLSLDVNCADSLGRNALHIAIENEHAEILYLLLEHNLEIGDGLLHAISEENVEAVEIILTNMAQRPKKKDLLGLLGNASSVFTPDITPLVLAAHRDNFHIIRILLHRGDTIPKPHDLRCTCHECVKSHKEDSLRHSLSRINAYRALASPSLICLSSDDPILTAFELSWELKRLGKLENEFKDDYETLSSACHAFATDLVAQTRGYTELTTILNHDPGQVNTRTVGPMLDNQEIEDKMSLSRLKLAIKYKQKSFIAHPHCQQLLASIWYEGLPGFRSLSLINQSGVIGLIGSLFPLISTAYIMAPKSQLGSQLKKPFIKFVCHQSSYLFFLLLITTCSMRLEFILFDTYEIQLKDRGPPPSIIEWAIILYIAGYVWQEIKQLYSSGLLAYATNMWNLLDFGTNALYVATMALRVTAYANVYNSNVRYVYRGQWDTFEPVLISECLFAGANIISTLKLVFLFTISPTLGPLQISLGRMLGDVLSFFSLYILVIVAYAIGFQELYWFYSHERDTVCSSTTYTYQTTGQDLERYQYCTTRGRYFTSIFQIVQALYWSAFGLIDVTMFNLEHPHVITEFIGKLMFGSFCYISIIMLLNMFIAMMNNSFQRIAEKADMEWKYARSKFWISYFEEGGTVPVPFNIIPTPKSCYYFFMAIKELFCGCNEKHNKWKLKSMRNFVKKVSDKEARHHLVVKDLIKRYLISRQKAEENKGVTEDDLNEIKGDINSFKFELMEALKMNGMKVPTYANNKAGGKLRRKGSRKGFNQFAPKMNLPDSVEILMRQASEANKDNGRSGKNFTKGNGKLLHFDNKGFQNNDEVIKPSDSIFNSSYKGDILSRRQSKAYTDTITQPLNASELLEASTNTNINQNIPSDNANIKGSDYTEKVEVNDIIVDVRYDMV